MLGPNSPPGWAATKAPNSNTVATPGRSEADLIAHCREHLAGYKCPKRVEFVAALPRTATGKLQKFRLREQYWAGYERQVN